MNGPRPQRRTKTWQRKRLIFEGGLHARRRPGEGLQRALRLCGKGGFIAGVAGCLGGIEPSAAAAGSNSSRNQKVEPLPTSDDVDLPAHGLDQAAADGQPKPRAPEAAADGGIGLGEGAEQALLMLAADPDAGVDDFDKGADPPGRRRRLLADAHGDFARLGELDGVAEQIEQDLADPRGVALDRSGARGPASRPPP